MAEPNLPDERLEAELRELGGRLLVEPAPPGAAAMVAAVRSRVADVPISKPARGRLAWPGQGWPRRLAVAVVVVCVGAALVAFSPQVRDGIVTLLRFAGVEVGRSTQPMPASELPTVRSLPGERAVSLAEARRLARFEVHVPAALGDPTNVLVADGRPPRVVTLEYAGPVRLDQFDGTIDFAYFKKVGGAEQLEWTDVRGEVALWVEGPHAVGYVGRDKEFRLAEARLAANTLIWQSGRTTLRLEGDFTRAEAIGIAESTSR
ncbi:hypothetical protein [Flindersiella endophytica]